MKNVSQKPRKMNGVLLITSLVLALVVLGVVAIRLMQPKAKYQVDANALHGMLEQGRTKEEIQELLNQTVDEGIFNVSINSLIYVNTEKKANIRIENIPGNHYGMQVTVVVTDSVGTRVPVYTSKVIKPGYSIETATFDTLPPEGYVDAIAEFHAINLDNGLEEGVVNVKVVLATNVTLGSDETAEPSPTPSPTPTPTPQPTDTLPPTNTPPADQTEYTLQIPEATAKP